MTLKLKVVMLSLAPAGSLVVLRFVWDLVDERKSLLALYSPWAAFICVYRSSQDPLIHYGRHFGRTIHAFSNVQNLILNGLDVETRIGTDNAESDLSTMSVIYLFSSFFLAS